VIGAAAAPLSERMACGVLAAIVAAVWLAVLPVRPLFNPDEGRYAEIPREMLASGDFVIPHLDGLVYIEKPPLQYWVTAAFYRVMGAGPLAARLCPALAALACLLVTFMLADRLWGRQRAWRAAAVLASLPLFPLMGQLLTLDMTLCFCMTTALAAFLQAQRTAAPLPWMLTAWAATAAGVLTKGLVAAAIPVAVLLLYSLLTRDWAPWRRLSVQLGLPLFALLCVPWFWLAAERLPEFLGFFFVREHALRYFTAIEDRGEPWWFFGAVLLAGTLPWSCAVVRVLSTGWRRGTAARAFDPAVFLWVWVVFVCGFFSLSQSKLIPYVLPAWPALALLVAASPAGAWRRDLTLAALVMLGLAAVLAAAALVLPHGLPPSDRSGYFAQLAGPLWPIVAVLGASAGWALATRARPASAAGAVLGAGGCLAVLLLMRAAALVAPVYSGASLAAAIPLQERSVPMYSVATYDQTVPFYLARTVSLVAYRGELDFGLRHAPPAATLSVDEFVARWTAGGKAFAVMESDMFDELQKRGVPMRIVAHDVHRILVVRS